MSITKRYLEGGPYVRRNPEDREALAAVIDAHTHRLPGKRKSKEPRGPTWDPFWQAAVEQAEREVCVRGINVNGALRYQTVESRDAVKRRAEER